MTSFFEGTDGNVVVPHSLDDHTNVNLPLGESLDGQVLTYNLTAGMWEAETAGTSIALDDITDVDASTPTDGHALTWVASSSKWEPVLAGAGAPINLDDILDVTITNVAGGDR